VLNEVDPLAKVQLSISCRNLANLDYLTNSDPLCLVYMQNQANQGYFFIGQTEMINNNLNPDFTNSVEVNYYFEKEQHLRFEVYDIDSPSKKNLIGIFETKLSKIMSTVN